MARTVLVDESKFTFSTWMKRIFENCSKLEIAFWWVFRAAFIYGFISAVTHPYNEATGTGYEPKIVSMMVINFAATFLWEIFQALPKKFFLRYAPSYVQDVSTVLLFLTAFCGAYINWYYTLWWWDVALHTVGGGLAVIAGYEIISAIQRRDKSVINYKVVLITAFALSFVMGTAWEIFEFTFDQIFGGDTQHWSYALAIATGSEPRLVFQPDSVFHSADWYARYGLIDTMEDTVANTVGAIVAYIALLIFPYNHKGKININKQFSLSEEKTEAKEYAVK